jgi:hypothetical protein
MRAVNAPPPPAPAFQSLIKPSRYQLTDEQFRKYEFLVFEKPELRRFEVDGEDVERYKVTVKHQNGKHLGYLPLPAKYHDAWVHLCYTVVYQRNVFSILQKLCHAKELSSQERGCAEKSVRSTGAILRHYLWARRHIIKELLDHGGGTEWLDPNHCLVYFNEFIIKERFDYHWDCPQPMHLEFFTQDALCEDMKEEMSKCNFEPLSISLITFFARAATN